MGRHFAMERMFQQFIEKQLKYYKIVTILKNY
jgi:hypothetical protein